jgi:hypothetical protein
MLIRSIFRDFIGVGAMLLGGVLLLATTQNAPAGNTVRDHRGPSGTSQGGVSIDGKPAIVRAAPRLPGYRGFRGLTGTDYGKGGVKTGATLRDHR